MSNDDSRAGRVLTYILRHGAAREHLVLRRDGFVAARDLLALPKLTKLAINVPRLATIAAADSKGRFDLAFCSCPVSNDAPNHTATNSDANVNVNVDVIHNEACKPELVSPSNVTERFVTSPTITLARLFVRAAQGHSLRGVDVMLDPTTAIISPNMSRESIIDVARDITSNHPVHGTHFDVWPQIVRTGGLSRMKRNHIHFAILPSHLAFITNAIEKGGNELENNNDNNKHDTESSIDVTSTNPVSGMRASSDLLIFVDVERAVLEGNVSFWRSTNDVLLTAGIPNSTDSTGFSGILPLDYFKCVVHIQDSSTKRFTILLKDGKLLQ